MKVRVIEKAGWYYPQYHKFLWFWSNFSAYDVFNSKYATVLYCELIKYQQSIKPTVVWEGEI